MSKVVKLRVPDNVYNYWFSAIPEKCRKCECIEMNWTDAGDPKVGCELDECYQSSAPSTRNDK